MLSFLLERITYLDLLYTNPNEWLPQIQLNEPQGDVLKFLGMPAAEQRDEADI
jgi:hypothetical protein